MGTVDDWNRAMDALARAMRMHPPLTSPVPRWAYPRPLAAVQLDIDRATIPAMRAEDC